jgi:hypothetical protein
MANFYFQGNPRKGATETGTEGQGKAYSSPGEAGRSSNSSRASCATREEQCRFIPTFFLVDAHKICRAIEIMT